MKALKFINIDEDNVSLEEYKNNPEKVTTYKGSHYGIVNAMIAECLSYRFNIDLYRLENKDIEHILGISSNMLTLMAKEYKYLKKEFYEEQ